MEAERSYTLSELSRLLDTPQHRLIHLCEKGVLEPELQDAHGRGSSRLFSERNLLEFAVALRLREMRQPVAVVGAVLHVLRALEDRLQGDLAGFLLPESLAVDDAPDLRVILSDGATIFFSLAAGESAPRMFGGVALDQLADNGKPAGWSIGQAREAESGTDEHSESGPFGGPEGSRFARLELSITEIARALPLR